MAKKFEITAYNTILELLKNKSLDEISAADITDAAGLTKQAFYYHAKNLPDFLCGRINRQMREIVRSHNDTVNQIVPMVRQILLGFRENRTIFAAMMQSKHGSDYLECLQKAVYSNILEIVRHFYGRVPEKYDEDVAKHFAGYISDSVYGVLLRDLQSGMTEDVDELIRDYRRFHNEAYSIKFEKYIRSIRQENM